ncbi:MAG: hypothetical protein J6M39_06635 [Lachnospiraceae bacterium]|nr:hypothetical protein [Lachnospiraceae bacterium]
MEKEKYTVENIKNVLNRVQGIQLSKDTIKVDKNATFGTKTLGKIDFLKKNGYTVVYVDSFKKVKEDKSNKEDFGEQQRKKKKKGIDVLSNVKSKMKMSNFKMKK